MIKESKKVYQVKIDNREYFFTYMKDLVNYLQFDSKVLTKKQCKECFKNYYNYFIKNEIRNTITSEIIERLKDYNIEVISQELITNIMVLNK